LQEGVLEGFGDLVLEGLGAVEDADSLKFQMAEPGEGVEDAGAVLAAVGRGAHAVEEDAEGRAIYGVDCVEVVGGEELLEGSAATLEFGEDVCKPLRVLVEEGERSGGGLCRRSLRLV
jgi:hypothetical protein